MPATSLRPLAASLAILATAACAPSSIPHDEVDEVGSDDKAFTSARASLVTFEFDGQLRAPQQSNLTKLIQTQMVYTVGQLNAYHSVARLDRLVLTDVKRTNTADGWMTVTYRAKLEVGWGSEREIPETFDLTLPTKIGPKSLEGFMTKYGPTCSDDPAHVTAGNYWYHYRPQISGCAFDDGDAVRTTADVTVAAGNTSAKYPEYDRIWSDGTLRVVAVFGKYADFATSPSDAGIDAYDDFIEELRGGVAAGFATAPANVGDRPGVSAPDVTFTGKVGGRDVVVNVLLIDSPKLNNATFDARYADLTKKADLILYNGHAGLGANVKALSQKGTIEKGQYRIFFLNGCDTFAYLDDTFTSRVAAKNSDDPRGTKYADVLTNLMPAYFRSMPDASLDLIDALARPDAPKTYEAIFASVDASQVIVATGEEDNTFVPSAQTFSGIDAASVLGRDQAHRFETPVLQPGRYVIKTRENGSKKGDVDLYVGLGYPPGLENYDHRPYLWGSNEDVTVELKAPAAIHVMVHGYEDAPVASNAYTLSLRKQ